MALYARIKQRDIDHAFDVLGQKDRSALVQAIHDIAVCAADAANIDSVHAHDFLNSHSFIPYKNPNDFLSKAREFEHTLGAIAASLVQAHEKKSTLQIIADTPADLRTLVNMAQHRIFIGLRLNDLIAGHAKPKETSTDRYYRNEGRTEAINGIHGVVIKSIDQIQGADLATLRAGLEALDADWYGRLKPQNYFADHIAQTVCLMGIMKVTNNFEAFSGSAPVCSQFREEGQVATGRTFMEILGELEARHPNLQTLMRDHPEAWRTLADEPDFADRLTRFLTRERRRAERGLIVRGRPRYDPDF